MSKRRAPTQAFPARKRAPPASLVWPDCTCKSCDPSPWNARKHDENAEDKDAPFRSTKYKNVGLIVELPDVHCYDTHNLAEAVKGSVEELSVTGNNLSSREKAFNEWKAWMQIHRHDEADVMTGPRLSYLFALLNEMLFWGCLRNCSVVRRNDLTKAGSMKVGRTDTAKTRATKSPYNFKRPELKTRYPITVISMDPKSCGKDRGFRQDGNLKDKIKETPYIVSILLYEMCHAIIETYSCQGCHSADVKSGYGHQCTSKKCSKLYNINAGPSGHGRAFATMAKAIEDNSLRLLGFRVALRHLEDIRLELYEKDGWRPSECDGQNFFSEYDQEPILNLINVAIDAHTKSEKATVVKRTIDSAWKEFENSPNDDYVWEDNDYFEDENETVDAEQLEEGEHDEEGEQDEDAEQDEEGEQGEDHPSQEELDVEDGWSHRLRK
ncbi:hypothetical protein EJ08DRAFT_77831 [Tothia fuscella]|uniref:Uncharacterized protein n=1 Tax=Tothia fuscella TaxID=1048955 RepID=A0A9P4U1E9_9PEZI|nr:hypothetical protein EJ08DRAFT_77831 [Tothia fuscella]